MFGYKPRNLEIDAMVVNAFSDINKKLSQYNLRAQKIYIQ